MKKVVAIIQARMGSSRLPGKVMRTLRGEPMILTCLKRLRAAKYVDQVVVATTVLPEDDVLVDAIKKDNGITIFRGDPENVLSRYYEAAADANADVIVRSYADSPLVDPLIVDSAIIKFQQCANVDYCSNKVKPTFPVGFDTEVFSMSGLETIYNEETNQFDLEHVTTPFLRQKDRFKLENLADVVDNSDLRVTVDYEEDFEVAEKIYSHFDNDLAITHRQVINFLRENKDIAEINGSIDRYDGFTRTREKLAKGSSI